MAFRKGETGKRIIIITSFDMSSNTSLQIKAVPPSGTGNTKTWTATLGSGALSNITLEDGTTVSSVDANNWMYYDLSATTDLDEVGTWTLVGIYNNTGASPADIYKSDPVSLSVLTDNYS